MVDKIDPGKNGNSESALRGRAEGKLSRSPDRTKELEGKTPEEIIHELQVHEMELEMQNEELKRVQLALEESRDKYQNLYDFTPVGYFTLNHKGIIKEVNLTGATLLGMPRPKLIGRGFSHFVAPENLDQWDQHIIAVLGHEEKHSSDLILRADNGSLFDAHLESIRLDVPTEIQPSLDGSHEVRLHVGVIDISELKSIEKSLRESDERYRTVADLAYDWEYWVDAQGNFLYVSPSCERITGYSAQEFLADPDLMNRIIHPDDRNEMVDHYHNVKNMVPDVMEARDFRIIHRGGETRWIGHVCQPVYDKNGQPSGRRGSNRDITDRKLMEEHLQSSEKFLEQIVENIPNMIFVKDAENLSFVRFNKAGEELLGYSREDLIGKSDYDLFPSSQADFFIAKDMEVLRNGKLVEIPEEKIDTRLKGKRVLHTKKIPILNTDGSAQFLLGISEDITERKQSEEKNLRLAAIVDSSDDAIIGKTLDGTITSWNKGAESLYGYRSDEVIGQPVSILLPPELFDDFPDILTRINRGELVSHVETKRLRKDGTIVDVSLNVSPIKNPQGQIIGASSTARDITERKRLEEERTAIANKLLYTQKLESLNAMAGGIAHDFNNQLAVVLGNLELALTDLPPAESEVKTSIINAISAAKRLAELSRQIQTYTGSTLIFPRGLGS